uniref:Xylulose 5-phosphate/Fructose 6-phosphate phosphoketolase N-terminal domain-containing protein n=1 Tax=Bionectria ochroleuca TaxID=29856 RepID=A0A8H7MY69_BIOOC
MPGQFIDRPNPPALPSALPEETLDLAAKIERKPIEEDDLKSLKDFQRAACYIAGAMIFLEDNVLLEEDLNFDHIKPRLLGHWGTCPGLILVWSHLNLLIRNHGMDMIHVIAQDTVLPPRWQLSGWRALLRNFTLSVIPHINSEVPGSIHEGGELGYALAVSFGAVMDHPDLIVTCVIGDGEAESGPTAAAWHSTKFLDPAESGAVIPILHVNGFKISERTMFGCMDDKELVALFSGYGYQVYIVEDIEDIDRELSNALEWAVCEIKTIQRAARGGKPIIKPRWPMLILRTPKGWTGPKKVDGDFIEGSFKSHQIPIPKPKENEGHLKLLQDWLSSYDAKQLIQDGKPIDTILNILPNDMSKRLGQFKMAYDSHITLDLPNWKTFAVKKYEHASAMQETGKLLDQVAQLNPKTFRIFSPTNWRGYTLTGRTALFPSYESFLGIVHTMMVQYCKFSKLARQTDWRRDISSINYIETSTWARQEHNGFSHQNPSFIGAVLNIKGRRSKNFVNLMIGSKQPTAAYLSADEAAEHCRRGASIWNFASNERDGQNPDVVLVGIGVEVTFETVKAAHLLRELAPSLSVRVINVTDLMVLALESRHPHAQTHSEFVKMFTEDRPICFNYHGYATELQGLLFGRPRLERMSVEGYKEEGSTTTPFDMMMVNKVSRYDLASRAIRTAREMGVGDEKLKDVFDQVLAAIEERMTEVKRYIQQNSKDPDDIYNIPEFEAGG